MAANGVSGRATLRELVFLLLAGGFPSGDVVAFHAGDFDQVIEWIPREEAGPER